MLIKIITSLSWTFIISISDFLKSERSFEVFLSLNLEFVSSKCRCIVKTGESEKVRKSAGKQFVPRSASQNPCSVSENKFNIQAKLRKEKKRRPMLILCMLVRTWKERGWKERKEQKKTSGFPLRASVPESSNLCSRMVFYVLFNTNYVPN
jgi:hypothetical protein